MYFPAPSPPRRPHCIHNNAHTRTNTHTQNPAQPSRQHAVSAAYCFVNVRPRNRDSLEIHPWTRQPTHASSPARRAAQTGLSTEGAAWNTHAHRPPLRCATGKLPTHTNTHPHPHTHTHTRNRQRHRLRAWGRIYLYVGVELKTTQWQLCCVFLDQRSKISGWWRWRLQQGRGKKKPDQLPLWMRHEFWMDGWMW